MSGNGGRGAPGTGNLISIERVADINSNNGPPSGRLQAVPILPAPNYFFRRFGSLNTFFPNMPVGALAERPPPPQGSHPQQQTPFMESVNPEDTPISPESPEDLSPVENVKGGFFQIRDNPYGKFTPLFGGRIVLGDGKWWLLASLVMYASLLGNTAFMQGPLEKHCGGFPVYVTGIVWGALTFCTFLIIGVTDPGVVPKNYSLGELLAETEEFRARHPDKRYFQYCLECRTCRPPRTFHCHECDICIRQVDVHLEAAGTCIGERNRRSYFFHVVLSTCYGTYLLVTSLILTIHPHLIKASTANTREIIQLSWSWLGVIMLVFCLDHGTIPVLVFKIYLLCVGRTWREVRRKQLLRDTNDCIMGRRSAWANVRNFFCQRSMPSAFRHRINRIDPEGRQTGMPDAWIVQQRRWERPSLQLDEIRDFYQDQMQNFRNDVANTNVEGGSSPSYVLPSPNFFEDLSLKLWPIEI